MKKIILLLSISLGLIISSCKKTYSCKAKFGTTESVFKCENCKKEDVASYKKEIEDKGYTDVTCNK